MLQPWWEVWPGRLEHELKALDDAGIGYERDKRAFSEGKLVLRLHAKIADADVRLEALFPDIYPYTRFELIAPELNLRHHQNPISKNLCLIGSATENWHVDDTLAAFIRDRMPLVIEAANNEDLSAVTAIEEHQAEPVTAYYKYQAGSMVLIDSGWSLDPGVQAGEMSVGFRSLAEMPVRTGAVLEIKDSNDNTIAQADDSIQNLYPIRVPGIWLRSPVPILAEKGEDIYSTLRAQHRPLVDVRRLRPGDIQVVGLLFSEELKWRKPGADGWIFLVRYRYMRRGFRPQDRCDIARAGRAGRSDLIARTPELRVLLKKKVAVIGLGCLGAPSTIEFAKAGVGVLRLVDHDFVEPGTIGRWPLGLSVAGLPKTEALKFFIKQNFPNTSVEAKTHMLGSGFNAAASDIRVLKDLLEDVDLIYDATAEIGVQHFLSDLAREKQITYACVSTTTGAWGGCVVRIRPGKSEGCWTCFQHALKDGTLPTPPADPAEPIQPSGCAAPTFTGAAFDVLQTALSGVRLCISTLCSGVSGGYPTIDWDVGILSLRDTEGKAITPTWATFALKRHPSCQVCGSN